MGADYFIVIYRLPMFKLWPINPQEAVLNGTGGHDIAHKTNFFMTVGNQQVRHRIPRIKVIDDDAGNIAFVDIKVKENNRNIEIMKQTLIFIF